MLTEPAGKRKAMQVVFFFFGFSYSTILQFCFHIKFMNYSLLFCAAGQYSDDDFMVAILFLDQCQLFVCRTMFERIKWRTDGSAG